MANNKSVTWTPNQKIIDKSKLSHFLAFLNSRGSNLQSFVELKPWAIEHNAEFWSMFWDFAEIIGKKGATIINHHEHIIDTAFFPESKLNYAENLLQYNGKNKPAIIFQAEDKIKKQLSWDELKIAVAKTQQQLIKQGINKGDIVAGVMANTPEAVIIALATASLGAIWTACSPDFGVNAIIERFKQVVPKLLFFTESYFYNGKQFSCIKKAQETMAMLETCQLCIVVPLDINTQIAKLAKHFDNSKFAFWQTWQSTNTTHNLTFTRVSFNDPLFILYSSGTTGKPKCIVHGVGGTLIEHLKEHQLHCNIQQDDRVFYFTTCSWMMWNWQISALASKATIVLFDGSPFANHPELLFNYADTHKVTLFGTSAKYLSVLEKDKIDIKKKLPLSNLRTIVSTGSPLLDNSYDYVYKNIKRDIHLTSISGGTDIIGCFVLGCSDLPVITGEIQCSSLGLDIKVFDNNGDQLIQKKGELVCCNAFPSMPIYFWHDYAKTLYKKTYFERFDNVWTHGDFIATTANNGFIIYGRSDTTLNPGGVRIGSAEIYTCLEKFEQIVDAVVVGIPDQDDIQVLLFVVLAQNKTLDAILITQIKHKIKLNCSPRHVPSKIIAVKDIPKTRSGKTSEIAVKNTLTNIKINNFNSLSNPEALDNFKNL